MKVRVVGRARNYSTEKMDIRYTFVRSVEDLESPVTFRDGNDIYLRFSSPVAGSLCVYLVDEDQNAFCLLPYATSPRIRSPRPMIPNPPPTGATNLCRVNSPMRTY